MTTGARRRRSVERQPMRESPRPIRHPVKVLVANVEFWPDDGLLWIEGHRVNLTRREAEVLAVLVREQPHVVTHEAIHERVWNETMPHGSRHVHVHVYKLRAKLDTAAPDWTYIHTYHRVGYRFEPEQSR